MKPIALSLAVLACACHARSSAPPERRADVVDVTSIPDAAPPVVVAEAPDAKGEAGCTIELGALVSAEVFRGARNTPVRRDHYERLSPREQANWDAHDHGLTYLLCRHAVTMNGERYTFEHVLGESPHGDRLDPKTCDTAETRALVTKDIHRASNECTDPHAHAYWGSDLVPVAR